MDQALLQLLIDLHRANPRQGPGGEAETLRAAELAGLDATTPLKIADIGCGTGAASLVLAKNLDCEITAVDFLPEFLEDLESRAKAEGVADRITTLHASMDALPFEQEQFDVIWSEGAIYNMGFEAGVSAWRDFLKPGGTLVVSEINWLTAERPPDLQSYWVEQYPEIDLASNKIAILEKHGYTPQAYFTLPEHCWLQNYYDPMREGFESFLERNAQSPEAQEIVASEQKEIALYKSNSKFYSYGVYIAQKR